MVIIMKYRENGWMVPVIIEGVTIAGLLIFYAQ
jgi:hypothetical protein